MAAELRLPQLTESTGAVKLSKWLKNQGDSVTQGEPIAEVESEKASVELEAPVAGVLQEVHVQAGNQDLQPGTLLAVIEPAHTPTADVVPESAAAGPESDAHAVTSTTASAPADPGGGPVSRILATPLAARVAEASDVALAAVPVAGRRITRADVEALIHSRDGARVDGRADTRADGTGDAVSRPTLTVAVHADCRVDTLQGLLRQMGESGAEVTPTLTDFLVAACTRVLQQFPSVDAREAVDGDPVAESIDIAVTVATSPGVATLVLRGCERKTLLALSRERQALREQALAGPVGEGTSAAAATLALTHLEVPGLTRVAPSPGRSRCALGVGSIESRASTDDALRPGHVVGCTFVADREAFDEARAAAWIVALRQLIEDPMRVLLGL